MTDRHKGLVVTLDQDIRGDDLQPFISAIRLMKHVVKVEPVLADFNDQINQARIRSELGTELWEIIHPDAKRRREEREKRGL